MRGLLVSVHFNRALLLCLMISATLALIGLVVAGGLAGFVYGFSLLFIGAVGFSVLDEVWDDLTEGDDA